MVDKAKHESTRVNTDHITSIDGAGATRRSLIAKITGGAVLAVWHKPMVNAVMTPAHAQTSVVLRPEDVCPMVVIGNISTGPVSGSNTPPVCTATFDALSADATTDLTISSIDAGTLPANVTIDIQDLGTATSITGPRIVWRGPASDAPFCTNIMPIDDVTLTITATCAAAPGMGSFVQTFTLNSILNP